MATDLQHQTLCQSSCDATQLPRDTEARIEVSPTSDVALGLNLSEDSEQIFYYCEGGSKPPPSLTEFHSYPDFPAEIRRMIMRYTFPGPRIVELRFSEQINSTKYDLVCSEVPVALQVCKEWRNETVKSYPRLFDHRQCRRGCPTFFNPRMDTLHLRDDYHYLPGMDFKRCAQIEKTLKILPDKDKVRKLSCTRNSFWPGVKKDIGKRKPFVLYFPRLVSLTLRRTLDGNIEYHRGECRRPTRSHGCGFVEYKRAGGPDRSWDETRHLAMDGLFMSDFYHWLRDGVWGDFKGWGPVEFRYGGLCRMGMGKGDMRLKPARDRAKRACLRESGGLDSSWSRRA